MGAVAVTAPDHSRTVADSLAGLVAAQRAEINRLKAELRASRAFQVRLAERIYAAHTVLANLAERRAK